MSNKLPVKLFLAIILVGWFLVAAQPQDPACVTYIDPAGTPIPTCTPTPMPQNPRRYVAGSNSLPEMESTWGNSNAARISYAS